MDKKMPSTLSQEDINIFQTMEMLLRDTDETFSQSCMRYGGMRDKDLRLPMQTALQALCEDNPELKPEEFDAWYHSLIEDEQMFRLSKKIVDVLEDVRLVFNEHTDDWIAEGLLDPNYDTNYAFLGIIGMAIHSTYQIMRKKYDKLSNNAFYKNPLFGKYKITALEYADKCTLNDFQNPHAYNRFDVEAILFYVMDEEFHGYDSYKEYQQTLELFQEVKNVVYENPNRLLDDTKRELEECANHFKEKKLPYAFFYAAAVIDYWLNK